MTRPSAIPCVLLVACALVLAACGSTSTPARVAPSASIAAASSPSHRPTPTPDPTPSPTPSPTPKPTPEGMLDLGVPYKHSSLTARYDLEATHVERLPFACRGLNPPMVGMEELVEVDVEISGGKTRSGIPMGAVLDSNDFRLEDTEGHTYEDVFERCPPYQGQLWPSIRPGRVLKAYLYFVVPRYTETWLTFTDTLSKKTKVVRWAIP